MAIYHDPEDHKATFAGGTISQAMAKAKFQKKAENKSSKNHGEEGGEQSNLGGDNAMATHLQKAKEHLERASEMHTKGTLSKTQQEDPRKVDEEEEAPTMGEPGGSGLAYSGR
jgi:hypothetical protein